jgi:15-cis-phytoene synthase
MRDFKADPQAIMDAHAKSFSWAARFLSRDARAQAAKLYAFARLMDDLVDEPALGAEAERLAQFEAHRQHVLGLSQETGRSQEVGHMLLGLGVDGQVVCSFLDALQADAQQRHLQSLPDVLGFAYGVAGTVGQMMRPILKAQPQADRYAVALGMAMQLTNIARDVLEDARRGRCYLPAQWLPADWQLADVMQGQARGRQQAFAAIEKLLAEAEQLYSLAEQGFHAIPLPNRRAIEVACVLYRGIGRKIVRMGCNAYWHQRVQLSKWEKIKGVLQVLIGNTRHAEQQPAADVLEVHQGALQRIPGFPRALA